MNKQAITEAAERVRPLLDSHLFTCEEDGDRRTIGSRGIGITWTTWRDIKTIVLAHFSHLAAQRAAEEEGAKPIDEAWLRSLGFEQWNCRWVLGGAKVSWLCGGCHLQWESVDGYETAHVKLTTRGQLTALLEALQPTKGTI